MSEGEAAPEIFSGKLIEQFYERTIMARFKDPHEQRFDGVEPIQMHPFKAPDLDYGYEVFKIFNLNSTAFGELFRRGATGLALSEDEPMAIELVREIMADGFFSRPDDYSEKDIPLVTGGGHVECFIKSGGYVNPNHYDHLRFQGDMQELLEDDWPVEDTGNVAVALCHHLVRAGYGPVKDQKDFIIRAIRLNNMIPDADHDEDWMAVEIDVQARKKARLDFGVPYDAETGMVNLEMLMALPPVAEAVDVSKRQLKELLEAKERLAALRC